MTRTTPLRLTILQFRQIFFTEALTFMCILPKVFYEGYPKVAHQRMRPPPGALRLAFFISPSY